MPNNHSGALNIGDAAPYFEAQAHDGSHVTLNSFRGKKVILFFYPKDDTPGCTKQACAFRDSYDNISEKNAAVLGVSPDGEQSHEKFRSKYDLPFTLLTDPEHRIAEAYGVWGEKSMYGKKYMGIIRSHFVIDEQGTLTDVQYKISPQKSAPKAVAAL